MVKISVNLEEKEAQLIDQLAEDGKNGSKSEIIRTAIHEYLNQLSSQQDQLVYAVDHAFGVLKDAPLDANSLRNDSNESGRI